MSCDRFTHRLAQALGGIVLLSVLGAVVAARTLTATALGALGIVVAAWGAALVLTAVVVVAAFLIFANGEGL